MGRYTSKTWYHELKKRRLFFAIGLVTFCDIVYLESESLSVHGISPKHTARAILRQDLTGLIFTRPFFNIICSNSLEFSCLLCQPVINFSAATMKHVGAEKLAQFPSEPSWIS